MLETSSAEVGSALLFHDLQIDFLHIDLFTKFRRELGRLHEPCIRPGSHVWQHRYRRNWREWGKKVLLKEKRRPKRDLSVCLVSG